MKRLTLLLRCSVVLNLVVVAVLGTIAYNKVWLAAQANRDALNPPGVNLKWYDINRLELEGQGWKDTAHRYDRLPARARRLVSPRIWQLSENSAGLQVRFVTDATAVWARWTLRSNDLAAPHMAATGFSGLDLYVRGSDGQWHWAGVGRPYQFPANRTRFVHDLPPDRREYLLYLPLYNGIDSLQIGLPPGATFSRAPARARHLKPIIFYGTSITQGGVAARSGMAYPAILERRLQWPAINLGFSGNGKMQPEVVKLLAELDPAVYVIDCLPNMTAEEVKTRTQLLVTILRHAHPAAPIILVANATPAFTIDVARQRLLTTKNSIFENAFTQLVQRGVPKLYFVPGDGLFGRDDEATVDGTHPTDLGAYRLAGTLERVLRHVLGQQGLIHGRH
jgi:lysophospholipase L1-like esterase